MTESPAPLPSGTTPLPETYGDCLRFLYARNQFAMKLGLENINRLLDSLGRPDAGRIFLHVAGTNGKGSVCANLAALLRAAGYARVGLYTSPHLVSFRERILVDGSPVPKDWILAWMRKAFPAILEFQATYFECVTAMALDYFRDRNCGAAVLETGLGGRLDATNAVTPALTVVTSVSLDHTAILGDTVEAIWEEKIGILKPGVPMVAGEGRPHLLARLRERAAALGSPLRTLEEFPVEPAGAGPDGGELLRYRGRYGEYLLPASLRREAHQAANLRLSLLALETFLGGPLPAPEKLAAVLAGSRLPGRTQLLTAPGMLPVMLDGAHNPEGVDALARYLRREFPGRPMLAIFAMMRDKDYAAVYRSIRSFAQEALFVPLEARFPRALTYAELTAALMPEERRGLAPFPLAPEALASRLRRADGGGDGPPLAVVCGSLYLLGEVIPMLLPHYPGLEWFRQFGDDSAPA